MPAIRALPTILLLLLTGTADLALGKNCIWTNSKGGLPKDVLVWDDNVQVWSASHYWNWHYDNLDCFPRTWDQFNGYMNLAINDGARSIGFLYKGIGQGTYPDGCYVSSCTYVETGGKNLMEAYLPARGWRALTYCELNKISCASEAAVLNTGEFCKCSEGRLLNPKCTRASFPGLQEYC
ncbi:hypothetical protein DFJ73DRAFT_784749 [Zopfochytrium polystomum]|nr:hypothetical protein DFJ73DRAFT_784749 [Zopfochytrium polystomum]